MFTINYYVLQWRICPGLSPLLPPHPLVADGGDMDARDYVCMRYEKRLRDGLEDRSGHTHPIGRFERFTKVRALQAAVTT